MIKKAIYRTAITDMNYNVLFLSDIFFFNKEAAISEALTMFYKEEVEITTHKWEAVCFTEAHDNTWRTFEKVRNDSNERYIGIISETMILDVDASLTLI